MNFGTDKDVINDVRGPRPLTFSSLKLSEFQKIASILAGFYEVLF